MRGKGIKAWPPIVGVLAVTVALVGVSVQWAPAGDNGASSVARNVSTEVVLPGQGGKTAGVTPAAPVDPSVGTGPVSIDMGNIGVSPTDPSTWPSDMPEGMRRSVEVKMRSVFVTEDTDSSGPGGILADGGAGRAGDPCTCDNECGSGNPCNAGICIFDKSESIPGNPGVRFECVESPNALGTPCRSGTTPCLAEVCNGTPAIDSCKPAMCGAGTRICTPCAKECVGGQDQESPCNRDEDCLGGACEEKSGLAAASCSLNPGDATRFVCTIPGDVGRCCDAAGLLTPQGAGGLVTEAVCLADSTRGLWRRITDIDDLGDPVCPKFSAGIAPADDKTTDAARDAFTIHQTARGCTLIGIPATIDSRECVDATLDCVGLCKDATGTAAGDALARFGLNCKSDADCPDQPGCPGGVCTCGTVPADVECAVFADKCPVVGETGTPKTFTMVCDDYTMPNAVLACSDNASLPDCVGVALNHACLDGTGTCVAAANPGWLQLREFRYRGGPETPGDRVTFEFRGLSNDVVYAAAVTAPLSGGILTRTLQFDCDGNCQPGQIPAEPIIYIPRAGKVCMRSSGAQGGTMNFRTSYHWIQAATAGVDVGGSDPTVMWVDRNDGAGLVPLDLFAGSSNMIFEIDGNKVPDTDVLWACCDGGACGDTALAECTFCDGGPFNGMPCNFNRECGARINQEFLVCRSDKSKAPLSSLEVALGIGEKCVDGVCGVGACCDAASGSCSLTTSAACTGVYEGDGTNCEPNCCLQPALTGGDCCSDTKYCPNGNDPTIAIAQCVIPVLGAPCDASGGAGLLFCDDGGGGDLGACAAGAAVGDACAGIGIGSSFTGTCQPAVCKLCSGPAAIHTFTLPPAFSENRCSVSSKFCDAFGDPVCDDNGSQPDCIGVAVGQPCLDGTGVCASGVCGAGEGNCDPFNPVEVRLISGVGPNPSAGTTVTGAEGDKCGERIGSDEGGQFEVFDIDAPSRVTISWCCNNPPESPVFFVVFTACGCDIVFRDPGSFSFGVGGGAAAFCPDGGASFDVSLDTGSYALIKSTGATCQNSTNRCTQNSDCVPGILCENTNFGPYNVQLHVSPLPTAACCVGGACTVQNLFDCKAAGGVWLGPGLRGVTGSGVTTIPPIFDCSAAPCGAGSCCLGPGKCESNGVLGDITTTACATLSGGNPDAFVGGVNCLEKPCPACTLVPSTHCQPLLVISNLFPSSSTFKIFHAEDMGTQGSSLSELCFDWVWNLGNGCGGNEPDDKFDIRVLACDGPGGIPGTLLGNFQNNPTSSASENPRFGSALQTYGHLLSPPVDLTALPAGAKPNCVWIEITADDNLGCQGGWMIPGDPSSRILIGNNYGMGRFPDRPYDPLDVNDADTVLCIGPTTASLGTGTGFDGGSGTTVGPACCDAGTLECFGTGGSAAVDAFDCIEADRIFLVDKLCTDMPSPCSRPANDDCATLPAAFDIIAGCNTNLMSDTVIGTCSDDPKEVCELALGGVDCSGNDVAAGSATCIMAPTMENYICDQVTGTSLFSTTDGPIGVPELDVPPDDECGGLSVGQVQADVWHRVTAPCSGTMNVNMCSFGPVTNHVVQVYNNGCPAADNGTAGIGLVGCNNDTCDGNVGGVGPDLGVQVFSGVEYMIRVHGIDAVGPGDPGEAKTAGQGPYSIDVRFVCTAVAPPAPPTLAAAPNDKPKQKYITIDASVNPGQPLGIKVTELTSGKSMWVNAPVDKLGVSNWADLSATPVVIDWGTFSVLNITGCIIQPFGVYEINFVSDPAGPAELAGNTLSGPSLMICGWGDVQVSTPPGCDVGIGDIVLGINIATTGAGSIPNTHGDVQGDTANGELGIADIVAIINSATVAPGSTPGGYTLIAACP